MHFDNCDLHFYLFEQILKLIYFVIMKFRMYIFVNMKYILLIIVIGNDKGECGPQRVTVLVTPQLEVDG